jgi:hypothetical protein
MTLEALTSFTWPTGTVPLASLSIRVDDLAARLGTPVHAWNEDGLGPARGFGGRLPSGRVVLLEELQYAVQHHGARGPVVYVDAVELAAAGPEPLAAEVVAALGLSPSDLVCIADQTDQEFAEELATRSREARAVQGPQQSG